MLPFRATRLVALAAMAGALWVPSRATAQSLGPEPLVFGGGRLTLGGNASLSLSCAAVNGAGTCDADSGYFNFSDYERSTVRLLRVGLVASIKASERVAFLAELRTENGAMPVPYALFARIRPWKGRAIDIQAGRIPLAFGAFPRRSYASDNLLIGVPLAYQYLTSLRADAVPQSADELQDMRGRGWLSSFSIGNPDAKHGLPLATTFRWDTGVQVHAQASWIDGTVAVTTGSLANPLLKDDNGGKQVIGRLALHPIPGLQVGLSGARGAYLSDRLRSAGVYHPDRFAQAAAGMDAEYSRDYYLLRTETVWSRWQVPTLQSPVSALATLVEGRYKIRPRLYVAARGDRLGFSDIATASGNTTWEAPVTRLEVGGGYLLRRNLQVKVAWQHNRRDGGRIRRLNLTAVELGYWF